MVMPNIDNSENNLMHAAQVVVAVPPGDLWPVTNYSGFVDYLDVVKVVCGEGFTNGTSVAQVSFDLKWLRHA